MNRDYFLPLIASVFLWASWNPAIADASPQLDVIGEGVQWPDEWAVFAPMDRNDEPLPDEMLKSIPDEITVPARAELPERTIKPATLKVGPGDTKDLLGLFERQRSGNMAYLFLEIESPQDQEATFGIGGDWWVEVWMNGEPVFDTLEDGNENFPVTMLDHRFRAPLEEGTNLLAIRFITGRATSLFAIGGPAQFERAEQLARERARRLALNELPEDFHDRQVFPVETQAVATAAMDLVFPPPDGDLEAGDLVGLREMPARQLYFKEITANRGHLLDTVERRFDTPVFLRLSKSVYPWEDRHLDAILYTTPESSGDVPGGTAEVMLKSGDGTVLARHELEELSPHGLFFSIGFPETLKGSDATLEVVWRDGEEVVGRMEKPFRVAEASDVPTTGRVPLQVLNGTEATLDGAPMTVGVPFPRGALTDPAHIRLVDETGAEIPLQTKVTSRWSRFGPIRWLLCDFTVDLAGEERNLFLEYGPELERQHQEPIVVTDDGGGFPELSVGRLWAGPDGVFHQPADREDPVQVLAPEALLGGFVVHEDGKRYQVADSARHAIEELGSEKVVIRRTGVFVDPATGDEFCQYVTRLVFHRDSPVIRIFHTWIFTGDGNRDRITEMGWRFDGAGGLLPEGILGVDDSGDWMADPFVVQFDFDQYQVPGGETRTGRLPGVMAAAREDVRVVFGTKDFWQNFPSELGFEENAFTFFNWPRHNPPERLERPIAREDAFRSRFVHEGELLDFRIPDEYTTGEIFEESSSREGHWAEGKPESVNAQGIAQTEEMFLYFTGTDTSLDDAARVVRGLDQESLRTVVAPQWIAASGVFGNIHPRDVANYPDEERMFELIYTAPTRWVEQLGFYGMWLHGDYPTWSLKLSDRTVSTYRTLRKNHHDYPYRWTPFARSGDPALLKLAEAATRQMTDANFCHYATPEVDALVGPTHFRRQGWWDRSLLPWAGRSGPHRRSYTIDTDYLWDAYYLTGYGRARDVALLFTLLAPEDHNVAHGPRPTSSMMSSYLDIYQATFEPWFLSAVYEISDLYDFLYGGIEEVDRFTFAQGYDYAGHGWRGEQQKLYYFTGDDEHRRLALNNAKALTSPYRAGARIVAARAAGSGGAPADLSAFLWEQTGDRFYLGRAAAALDALHTSLYEGDIDYFQGTISPIGHGYLPLRNSRWDGPGRVLAAIHDQDNLPDPVGNPFLISGTRVESDDDQNFNFVMPRVFVKKTGADPVRLYLDVGRRPDQVYFNRFTHLEGKEVTEGEWRPPVRVEIPADDPEGTYLVELGGRIPYGDADDKARLRRRVSSFFFPIAEPDVPEVISFVSHNRGTSVEGESQGYWFFVPEGTKEFWVEFPANRNNQKLTVWNPSGEIAQQAYPVEESEERVRFTITVEPGEDGQLWRATGSSFTIDPAIPPYFSVSRSKWFLPEE